MPKERVCESERHPVLKGCFQTVKLHSNKVSVKRGCGQWDNLCLRFEQGSFSNPVSPLFIFSNSIVVGKRTFCFSFLLLPFQQKISY